MSPGEGHCLSKEAMQNEGGKRDTAHIFVSQYFGSGSFPEVERHEK